MKYLIAVTLCSCAMHHAVAQTSTIVDYNKLPDNFYISGTIGISFPTDSEVTEVDGNNVGISNTVDIDESASFSVAFGKHSYPWRFEIEFSHRSHDGQLIAPSIPLNVMGDVEFSSLMVNAYLDWYISGTQGKTALYTGMGVGVARIEGDYNYTDPSLGTFTDKDDDVVAAYQFMVGLSQKLTESVTLTGGYRLWVSDDPVFEGIKFSSVVVHTIEIGMRLDF